MSELDEWGSAYPILMNELYRHELRFESVNQALQEFSEIKNAVLHIPATYFVYDIENLKKLLCGIWSLTSKIQV